MSKCIEQAADQMVKPAWIVATWERNKQLVEEKISPEAIALTQAHASGKKIGGNCTPGEHGKLESEKQKYCGGSGALNCTKGNHSLVELRRRADLAQQCAIYRTRINQKCFAGGDAKHRDEARRAWKNHEDCVNRIFHLQKGK